MTQPYFIICLGIGCLILYFLWQSEISQRIAEQDREKDVSTIDDTAGDMEAVADLLSRLPAVMQDAIAAGKVSLTISWEEVTRDEDDYPTIKPIIVFKANLV